MIICNSPQELDSTLKPWREQEMSIGFVPTMGALHQGHLSLISKAQEASDIVVASIFVNPTQFDDDSDLAKYPRTFDADRDKLEAAGVHALFYPDVDGIYPSDHIAKKIDYHGLDLVMEGSKRPGHFDGVVEVVARLFELVRPDMACFGEKDFQQLAVIRMLVEQHDYPIEIIPCPIIREEHGLAMSSRNERLDSDQRKKAAILNKTLLEMKEMTEVMNPDEVEEWGKKKLSKLEYCELEYLEVAESRSLQPIFRWHECDSARAFVVARFGEIRLIDNLELYSRQTPS